MTDTHAHFLPTDDLAGIFNRALEAGVTRILAVGGSPELNAGALRAHAAEKPEGLHIHLALGLDRDQAGSADLQSAFMRDLQARIANPRSQTSCKSCSACLHAIGETGLDYHHTPHTRPAQLTLFAEMLALARVHALPVVIHSRDAESDTISILDEAFQKSPIPGVLHCFTGSIPFARKCLDRGLYISLSGIVTFHKAENLREIAAYVPLDRLLLETDSPYLAPIPFRGKPNQPAYLPHTAQRIAALRNLPLETLAQATTANAAACFKF